MPIKKAKTNKSTRGNSSQFFVAAELCRRGYCAVVTMGNTPNTDVLCSNIAGTKFVHIQVKTFVPGQSTCIVGMKAEKDFGKRFFWILVGIPDAECNEPNQYFIIPAKEMAKNVYEAHQLWLKHTDRQGNLHEDNSARTVHIPPKKSFNGWSIERYRNNWLQLARLLK